MTTPDDLKKIAPEVAGESDVRLQFFIDWAVELVSQSVFATRYDKAVALLSLHFLTLAGREGAGGNVSSESLGDWSRSYSSTSGSESELSSTSYGQMFRTLMKACGGSVRVLGAGEGSC